MTELEQAELDYFVLKTMHKRGVRRFFQVRLDVQGGPPLATMVSTKAHRDASKRKIKRLNRPFHTQNA